MKGRWIVVCAFAAGCTSGAYRSKPTQLQASTNKPKDEVMSCVLARASSEGFVPTNGGPDQGFLELTRGKANTASTVMLGEDMSYTEGMTVVAASEGEYQLSVYRLNANANRNNVRYGANANQMELAEAIWSAFTTKSEECLSFQSDYQECLERGGVDPTEGQE